MSRWHRENPDYLETGAEPPDYRAAADNLRKQQKEEGDLEPCRVCGEYETPGGQTCYRCALNLEEDRLERESGR